ncbi:MAG TPA: transcriptional regulator [Bacteroidales bacterium]|nr:transcriptional regulator [Bacteroidales bacterium]
MKAQSIEEVQDLLIGKMGTPDRDKFEYELQMDLIGKAIKQTRKERNLTQEELGKLIGVQKSQISRIESNVSNVTIDTLMRVFNALQAKVKLQVELPHFKIVLGQLPDSESVKRPASSPRLESQVNVSLKEQYP